MKLDVPDEYVPIIITALEHYSAYARAVQSSGPLTLFGSEQESDGTHASTQDRVG